MTATTMSLDGTWDAIPLPLGTEGESGYAAFLAASDDRLPATVPGEIHLDLLRAGKLADPNVGANARAARWPEQHSWWFRTTFTPPDGFRQHHRQRLVFDGIDMVAQVFVNGTLAGVSDNAFAPLVLAVAELLRDGENEVVVRVTSGMELLPPEVENDEVVARRLRNRNDPIHDNRAFISNPFRFIRKPAYMTYGWDWCDPLPNIGIWRSVRLEGHTDVAVHDLRLDTEIDGDTVALVGEIGLDNLWPWRELETTIEVRIEPPGGGEPLTSTVEWPARAGLSWVPVHIPVPGARLWWPNGMGDQPLYRVTVTVATDGHKTDRREQRIGLRTLEIDRSPTGAGRRRFSIRVNGQDVYCRGGDMAPLDLIPARITPERYRAFVAQARDAHFTMLRVNGVGIYESDDFYAACDEAGILLWQDFTFSCANYPDDDPVFLASVRAEAEANVRRLRSHPALAVWSGNNEISMMRRPDGTYVGQRIFTYLLADVCRALDPARPYWPSSPYGGTDPLGDEGDQHGWVGGDDSDFLGGSFSSPDQWLRGLDHLQGGFYTEYFAPHSTPHIDSVREYTGTADPVLGSDEWRIHTNTFIEHGNGALAPRTTIAAAYGGDDQPPLEDYILYGQLAQAQAHGAALEAMRFRKHDPERECQGALMWSFNDTWGETGWGLLDAYDRRKAGYYWIKRANRPIKVLVRSRDSHLVTRVVNDTLDRVQGVVRAGWMRLDGTASELAEYPVDVTANSNLLVTDAQIPSGDERDPAEWLYAAILSIDGRADDQAIWLLDRHRNLNLTRPPLQAARVGDQLEISSPVYAHAVHIDDGGRALLSDNYLELLPGIPQRVTALMPLESPPEPRAALPHIGTLTPHHGKGTLHDSQD